jgi:fructose-1,6-bisphosphatase/inositol monophosphatase family enzyme
MIAVMERATVLGGAVFCPAVDEIVVAALERGCWHNGARCAVSSVASLADATILTTSDRFPEQPARRTRWQALAQRAGIVRTWGDCFGYVLVATGRAEAMVDNSLHLWDYSPLVPIISEAGGTITNWRGTVDFAGDAIATNRALAADVRAVLLDPRAA